MTSLLEFVSEHREQDRQQGFFELESERVLEVNLGGAHRSVWMKVGAMIAYRGDIKFEREGMLSQGIGNLLKKAMSGEGASMSKAEGTGKLYLAAGARKLTVLRLASEALSVNGNDLLAVEPGLSRDIRMMKAMSGMLSGGFFNVHVEGTGGIVLATHGSPMVLEVTPGQPLCTDPQATVAWSGGLTPQIKTEFQFKSLLGRGSGESVQMQFAGTGFVIVQPYEEKIAQARD